MAASAEQNEIIELTDLIEKGPDLPKNSPKTPEPLPLPDEAQEIITKDPDCNLPEHAMLWNRLRELKKTNIDWSAIS